MNGDISNRFYNYDSYRSAWDQADKLDPPVPLNVDLELASVCNLKCPFCFIPDPDYDKFISQKAPDGKPLRRIMPLEMAFRIIDQCAEMGVPALKFNWRGESTLHPDYSEIVRHAYFKRPPFLDLLANTNANCPHKSIEGLLCMTKVMISLDSMVPETYAKMRVGGDLRKAQETIWTLIRGGHKNIWVRRVVTAENFEEPFFKQVHDLYGDMVKVSEHYCFDRNRIQDHEISGCDHDQEMPRKYCQYPSQRMIITSAGYVYPCCLDLKETLFMGDIYKTPLLEIWNSDSYKILRANLRRNDPSLMPKVCQKCESWMAYDMPQREFVKDKGIIFHAVPS